MSTQVGALIINTRAVPDAKPVAMCDALTDSPILLTSAPTRINESWELTLKGRRQRGKDKPPCYPESPMWSELKDTTCPGVV